MVEELIISQIKEIIIGGICRFAKKLGEKETDTVRLLIYTTEDSGYPSLMLFHKMQPYKEIQFGDLANSFERIVIKGIAPTFDINRDVPVWIQKFILKSASDSGFGIMAPSYLLAYMKDEKHPYEELRAFMYVNGKQVKEIELEYILTTK